MPRLLAMSSKKLIDKLKSLGFEGPFPGGKHRFLRKGNIRIPVPNEHGGKDVAVGVIEEIIKEIGYDKKKWIEETNR